MVNPRIPRRFRDPRSNESQRLRLFRRVFRVAPSDAFVARFRDHFFEGDPLADEVVRAFSELQRGEGHRQLAEALERGIDSVASPSPALVQLFRELNARPAWLDDEKLDLAARTSMRVGMSGAYVLSCVCLTGGYRSSA